MEDLTNEAYDNTSIHPWLAPALAQMGFVQHDSQSMMLENGITESGQQCLLMVRWFFSGKVTLSHEQQPYGWFTGYRGRLRDAAHLAELIDGIGWQLDTQLLQHRAAVSVAGAVGETGAEKAADALYWALGCADILNEDELREAMQRALLHLQPAIPPAPGIVALAPPSHGGNTRNVLNADTCHAGNSTCPGCGVCAGPGVTGAAV